MCNFSTNKNVKAITVRFKINKNFEMTLAWLKEILLNRQPQGQCA